jgi:vancomycin resistance protein VanW
MASYEHVIASYRLPLIDYPGQESSAEAKRTNQGLLASVLDGVVIRPGETWSLWRLAGRPTAVRGYASAAAIRSGVLTREIGGATCLLSTVVYNAALLAGLEITERHHHSLDTYGERRYFELGRDATIEYGYLDLRLRNRYPQPVRLGVTVDEAGVSVELRASRPAWFAVDIEVTPLVPIPSPLTTGSEIVVRTLRLTRRGGATRFDNLGVSRYRVALAVPEPAHEIRVGSVQRPPNAP